VAKAPTARRYAQALFALADEKNATEAWLDDLRELKAEMDDPTVALYLSTPRVPAEQKLAVVAQLCEGRDTMIGNLMGLLSSRLGTALLGAVAAEYESLLNVRLGRVSAVVTTAAPISDAQQERLRESLGTSLQKTVVLETREDPEIIGGVMVRVGDQIIDGSVRSKLLALKQRLAHESLT
jgi:F-type H+-transporting ATPase subunit delta